MPTGAGIEFRKADLDKISKMFVSIPYELRDKVIVTTMRRYAKPVETRMKQLCPVSKSGVTSAKYSSRLHPPGYLRSTIGTIVRVRGKYPTVWIRPRFTGGLDPWYEHFPMNGTVNYDKAQPNPFVDKTWDELGGQIEKNIESELIKQIEKTLGRLK